MLGFNLNGYLEAEEKKVESAVVNSPEFKAAKAEIKKDVDYLTALEKRVTPAQLVALLNLVAPNEFTAAEITTAEECAGRIAAYVENPGTFLAIVEKAL